MSKYTLIGAGISALSNNSKGEQRALFWCKVNLSAGDAVVERAKMREVVLSGVEVGMTEARNSRMSIKNLVSVDGSYSCLR